MISYDEALVRVLDSIAGVMATEAVPLREARGRILSGDVVAGVNLPPFSNSAVDGFAVRLADVAGANANRPVALRVTQTIAAGTAPTAVVEDGQAARILTGAMMPDGADGVVMVEDTRVEIGAEGAEVVWVIDPGAAGHIRAAGSDLPIGTTALTAGTVVDAGAIGLLAALNRATVPCYARVRVGVIATGDELVEVGPEPLRPGEIRNSNAPALAAAIEAVGGVMVVERHAGDSPEATREALEVCVAAGCDVILTSGGVSVGAFDYVKAVVEEMGALDFWRIAIKPGRPLAFGRIGEALFFGLPGNPVSSLVTFELFVRPALRKLMGDREPLRRKVAARLATVLSHAPARREFARVTLEWREDGYWATPTGVQDSHRLASVQRADGLAIAEEGRGDYAVGEWVGVMALG